MKPQPGGTLEALYTYDPLGRRVAKQVRSLVPTASASHALQVEQEQLTCFVWDGDLLLQEIADDHTLTHLYEPESFVPYAQVLSSVPATHYDPATVRAEQERLDRQAAEQQTEAETLAWLALTQPATHAQLQTTLAERDAQRQAQARQQQDQQAAADQVCYLFTDPLGTPQEAYSPDGRCLWQARYKAWGRIFKLDHAAIHQPLRFQGQYHDDETGLHYNRHRYYDPDSGRYLTQDPIGLEGGVNVYSYVGGNPIYRKDARGLSPEDVDKIRMVFNQAVDQMTKDGERIPVYYFNNTFADQRNDENPFWPKEIAGTLSCIFRDCKTTLICGQQWEKVRTELEKLEPSLDARWQFVDKFAPGHQYGGASSSDPSDPSLSIDPWKNRFEINYAK